MRSSRGRYLATQLQPLRQQAGQAIAHLQTQRQRQFVTRPFEQDLHNRIVGKAAIVVEACRIFLSSKPAPGQGAGGRAPIPQEPDASIARHRSPTHRTTSDLHRSVDRCRCMPHRRVRQESTVKLECVQYRAGPHKQIAYLVA